MSTYSQPGRAPQAPDRGDDELIAVTALDCRFPGAPDTEAFWDLLVSGRSGLSRLTEQELLGNGLPPRLLRNPAHVPVAGLIDGQDLFDPEPFGLTESEAALMDPQQRLFLESCLRALERAGHGSGAGAGAVGVFAGAGHSDYLTRNLARRYADSAADPVGSLQAAISGVGDYLPLHVAHRLALTGPAISVGTACSTSLVAVHLAAQSLLAGECDTALAGGASLIVPQGRGYLHVPDGIFSADGRVRPFSAEGTGIVHTQGVGVAVLRRLADALADGDPVLAVLHGSAVNNDGGDRTGFTAPSPRGQARAVAEALALAGVAPRAIGYVEAHGTATRLGDVVELAALKKVFGASGPAWCALGSVKSNIGHANSAAGIAGFAKAVLALHHGVLPPTPGARPLNPDLELDDSPFTVPDRAEPWSGERRAGVSSFGIGGTNCHVVLGSAPERDLPPEDGRPQLVLLSAHRDRALERLAEATATALADPGTGLADAAYTLHTGRGERAHRAAAVLGEAPGTTARALASAARRTVWPTRPRIVFAFPGGGAQYAGMGRELLDEEPEFARTVEECAALFAARGDAAGAGLLPLLAAAPTDEAAGRALRDPVHGLPALFTVSLATARTLRSWGVRADALIGHSLGEYAAAVEAGALRLADAVALVDVRSRGMSRTAGGGVMLSVALSEKRTAQLLREHRELDLAAVNAPQSCVISGPADAVTAFERRLAAENVRTARLHLDAAAHSRLVDPVLPELRAVARETTPSAPTVPLATTLTGQLLRTPPGADHWVPHLRSVVRFSDALTTALGPGPAIVVQVGPGNGLLQLVRQHGSADVAATLATIPGRDERRGARAALLAAAGELWTHGIPLDAEALHHRGRRRVVLPGLPLDRRRLWTDEPAEAPSGSPVPYESADAPDEQEPFQVPVWHRTPAVPAAPATRGRWLIDGPAGSPLTHRIRARLAADGAEPVTLTEASAEDAAPCTGIVLVDDGPHEEQAEADPARGVADAVLRYARLAAAAARWGADTCLLHVSTGAHQVESADRPEPVAAAALAVPRVLAQEFPGLRWRTLDLTAGPVTDRDVRRVCAEAAALVQGGPNGAEVAYRGGHRWLRGIVPWQPEDVGQPTPGRPAPRVAVVLGGLGDVGMALSAHLVRNGRQVVVTGREGLPADPAPGSPHAERAEALRQLRQEGVTFDIRAVDAADAYATTELLRSVTERYGPLGLVVHAAGVVASAAVTPLRDATPETVHAHARAKVSAAAALRSAVRALPEELRPEQVLLMSSATTFVGGLGLAPYAAVNRYLDALAEREATGQETNGQEGPGWAVVEPATSGGEPAASGGELATSEGAPATRGDAGGVRWLSVAWDGWRVGPGGTERVVASRHSIGLRDGMRALDRLLRLGEEGLAPASLAVSPAPLAGRTAGTPTALPGAAGPEGARQETGAAPRGAAELLLAALWSDLLGFPVTDRDADFFALGGHSLLATRMLARLRDDHGATVRLQDLLARPTVAALAQLVPVGGDLATDGTGGPASRATASAAAVTAPQPAATVACTAGTAAPSPAVPAPLRRDAIGATAIPSEPGTDVAAATREPATDTPVPEPAPDAVDFPLTRVQHAYWVGGSGGYRLGDVPCSFHLEYDCPDLDMPRYEEAWNRVIARHPMLRAVVSPEGRNRVLARVPRYRIRVQDLSGATEDERARRLGQIRDRMVRREPRPGRWPLVDIRAARLPGEVIRLFVNVDVLVCDTASYLIWDRELCALYQDPQAQLPSVRTTFAQCVAALEQRAASPERARAAAYWRSRVDSLPGPPALPVRPAPDGTRPRFGRRSARIEAPDWSALKAEAARRTLTPTAVLLAAYGDALADWSGQDRFDLTLTLFDRPTGLPGADEVVGDFTSLMLHTVDRAEDGTFAGAAARAQRTLFEDLDHREFSALELLAEKSARTGRTESVPVVFTSALGLSGPLGGGHDLDWVGAPVHGVSSTPQTWLDHQVLEQHGALLLQWDVLESELSAEEANRAFDAYAARVRLLARNPAAWDETGADRTRGRTDRARAAGDETASDATAGDETTDAPPRPGPTMPSSAPSASSASWASASAAVSADTEHDPTDAALLLRGGDDDRPLFLVHPSGGDVLCYSEIARLLTDRRPVVALTDPALGGGAGAADIATMVDRYLAALRPYQANGPYLLGGWSMGGTLAHAMACELQRRRERTDLLLMIDSNVPDRIGHLGGADPEQDAAVAAVRYLRSLEAFLELDLGLDESEADRLVGAASGDARRVVTERLREAGLVARPEAARVRLDVFERHLRALGDHRAGMLTDPCTKLLLFRAARPSPGNSGVGMGVDDASDLPCLGWLPHVAGPVEEVAVDGHHYSLLAGPAARRIAELTDRSLAALRTGPHHNS